MGVSTDTATCRKHFYGPLPRNKTRNKHHAPHVSILPATRRAAAAWPPHLAVGNSQRWPSQSLKACSAVQHAFRTHGSKHKKRGTLQLAQAKISWAIIPTAIPPGDCGFSPQDGPNACVYDPVPCRAKWGMGCLQGGGIPPPHPLPARTPLMLQIKNQPYLGLGGPNHGLKCTAPLIQVQIPTFGPSEPPKTDAYNPILGRISGTRCRPLLAACCPSYG